MNIFSFNILIIPLILINLAYCSDIISSIFSQGYSPLYSAIDSLDYAFNDNQTMDDIERSEAESFRGQLFKVLRDFIESKNISKANISKPCLNVINKYLFGHFDPNNFTNISYIISDYNIIKFLDDSSKNRNNLGSYEKCMKKFYKLKQNITSIDKRYSEENMTLFTYVVLAIEKLKKNITDEDINEIFELDNNFTLHGYCLPQGYDKENEYCTDEDYKNLLLYINIQLENILKFENSNISVFSLRTNPMDSEHFSKWEIFIDYLPFLFFIFLIVIIIIQLIMDCYSKSFRKNEKIIDDEDDEDRISDVRNKPLVNNQSEADNKIKFIDIINCFSLVENAKELFSFSRNSTKYNNDSGLNFIRGLIGLSMIFTALGFTFIALYNSPIKMSSPGHISEFFKDNCVLSPILMIGIRYSPRIILSCSGYLLSYKFISYLNKNVISTTDSVFKLSLKFISYQFHKYFLLIMVLLFERYSAYHLFEFFFVYEYPSSKFLYKYRLQKPDKSRFFLSFTLVSHFFYYDAEVEEYRNGNNILHYLWMPFNEILFFLIGILILSVGFKAKWRIDIIILVLIAVLYIGKIVYSYLISSYYKEKHFPLNDCYATLYYVFFNYGRIMINPLFNLPSFLIGLYFGLINYTIQKGIFDLSKSNDTSLFLSQGGVDVFFTQKEEEDSNTNDSIDENKIIPDLTDKSIEKKKEYCEEVLNMPFLITPIYIFKWLRNKSEKKLLLEIISFISIILFFFFSFVLLFFICLNDKAEEALINPFINFIYRIDIEFVVIIVQWLSLYVIIKTDELAFEFFNSIFWIILSRPYYSYILTVNSLLLFLFYHEATLTEINSVSILMFTLIAGGSTFIFMSVFYISFELPLKRLIRLCYKNDEEEKEKDFQDKDILQEDENDVEDIDNNDEKLDKIKNE